MRHDARLAFKQPAADFPSIETDLLRVPGDAQGRERTASRRTVHLGGYAGNARDLFANVAVPHIPLAEVGLNIALGTPYLYRAKHPDDFLLADFQPTSKGVVRRAVSPRCTDQVAPSDQQSGGLRAANDLPAAVGHQVGAER